MDTNRVEAELSTTIDRLEADLATAYGAHDLRRHELLAMQRGIQRLARCSMAPRANDFWMMTAQPRAQRLVDSTLPIIDRSLDSIATILSNALDRAATGTDDVIDRAGSGCSSLDRPRRLAIEERVVAALPSVEVINELGWWWQRRLRRTALVRSLPTLAARVPSDAELIVADHEMALLDRAPWSHGDRLLSAFELAHGEIRRHGRARAGEILRRAAVPAAPTLVRL